MERNPTVRKKIETKRNPELMSLLEGKSMLKRFGFNEPLSRFKKFIGRIV